VQHIICKYQQLLRTLEEEEGDIEQSTYVKKWQDGRWLGVDAGGNCFS
jgi:hypothetical protein